MKTKFQYEKGYTETLKCSKTTKELIMNNCIKAYLQAYPNQEGRKVTQNFILTRMAKKYLELI